MVVVYPAHTGYPVWYPVWYVGYGREVRLRGLEEAAPKAFAPGSPTGTLWVQHQGEPTA